MAADMITCSQLGFRLTIVLDNSLQTAWHLLSLVIASGRPDHLRELVSRCKFHRFTLHLIGSLCSMPHEYLTLNQVISITQSTFVAFTQALWNMWCGLAFVPRSLRYLERKGSLANVTKVYSRKRKRNVVEIQALPGGDMVACGGKCPPIFLDLSTQAQTMCAKNQVQESLPAFEGFIVKEEVASGGYGAVYKAIRKLDGVTLAIKCPRGNTNIHHVRNERKMLKQYRGENFILKYEGSFKHGSAACLVLQHVEHERPEVLKKEKDLFQLQWYGYCLFRALFSLHDQGVIHRDVKPGNFRFSRMANKGYLIDFNLSVNLYKIYGTTEYSPPAKSGPSNKVHSDERLKEPVPFQGRKELISLAAKAMHGPNQEAASPPTSKRKRIASPRDSNPVYMTPMPLLSSGVPIACAGIVKSRGGIGKTKEEGPCCGTKGFRAPEVLLKSPFQGPKIDVWSAGVTLVYLSTGRSPFGGDPDQNIMDIAKLRGSEELWEVAKLHNRESSFPMQLLDAQYLQSTKLRDWFGLNTKRPELFKDLSRSFFDLVEKCLTVNPRLRISAEHALKHKFFAQCHEHIRQQRRRRRQGISSNSATGL